MLKNSHGRYLQAHELFLLLGLSRGGHLPPGGFSNQTVEYNGQIVEFRCLPRGNVGTRKHRIEYHCTVCNRWVPYGRAGQHNKIH